jgi:FkbM family methyltransferase
MKIIRSLGRTIIERLGRGRIIKRRILVLKKLIPIFISPDAQLKYLKFGPDAFDRDLISLAEKYLSKSSHVWDVGANVGVFGFASSSIVHRGSVVLVEPDIWLASILIKTSRLKYYTNNEISIIPAAISSKNSVETFMIANRGRACNALKSAGGRSQMGGVRELQHVPTLTLDTVLESVSNPPDFVKIDIEGAELNAVNGAIRLINDIRPTFYIEVGGDVSSQIFTIFKLAGYKAFNIQGERLLKKCAPNTLFIPNFSN